MIHTMAAAGAIAAALFSWGLFGAEPPAPAAPIATSCVEVW